MRRIRLNIPLNALAAQLLLCLQLGFTSCGNSPDDEPQIAYLGGEILNPTTDHIVVKHDGRILDTIPLDEKNRFNYRMDSVENGLYVIQHRPENQNIYISPGDSLLFRVNTLAFDESLHFSGKGHAKNNFLSDMFLEDEKASRLLLSFHEYPPARFLQIADSIQQQRMSRLEQVEERHNFSEEFVNLAEDIIAYENRDLKERYTYLVQKYYKTYMRQFPADFHDYRENIDFNAEALQCSPGYRRFIENYLVNYSLSWCASSGLDNEDCYMLSSVENVNARLRKAGELVEIPALRQHLLKRIAVRGIVMTKTREEIISILQTLEEQKISEEDLDEMRQLGTVQLAFLPGTPLDEVSLVNMEGELVLLQEVVNGPTVVFLWSTYQRGHNEEHRLIEQYRKKYPEVKFIGINVDLGEEPAWRMAVRSNGYNTRFAYHLGETSIQKEFFRYYLDKLLFLNPSAEVVKGDIYLTSPEFEAHLLEFLNQ